MTLLDEVIAGASSDGSVAALLRQVKILAARTRTPVLQDWVTHELDGYPNADSLPAYRGPFAMTVLAHYVGFGREIKNSQLHPMMFPLEYRDSSLFNLWLMESTAEVEHLAKRDSVAMTWPADGEVMFEHLRSQGRLNIDLQGTRLAQVRCQVSSHVYVGVLDAVRNKVLDLALSLEASAPSAGTAQATDEEAARAATVITNHFHGTTNLAINGDASQLIVAPPNAGDRSGLLRYLAAAGVTPSDLADLEKALDQDAEVNGGEPTPKFARTRVWFAKQSTTVGTGVATSLLAEAAKSFLGG